MDKILVLGANGQVGRALTRLLGPRAVALSRDQADLSKPETLEAALKQVQASAVFNAAAYTQVDLAEKEMDLARTINATAPGVLARWCAARDIPFVHYSTDYVFSGQGTQPWTETDPTAPLNAYGQTKLEGEREIERARGKYLIFRTSWVYDSAGKNFLKTMLKFGAEKEKMRIVADQHGAPTYAPDLANASVKALENASGLPEFPSGIYHLCNSGETTWFGFAQAIFSHARANAMALKVKNLEAIATSDFPTPARRPENSRMSTLKARAVLRVGMPSWEQGLDECFKTLVG